MRRFSFFFVLVLAASCNQNTADEPIYLICTGAFHEKGDKTIGGMPLSIVYRIDEPNRAVSQRNDDGKWMSACPKNACERTDFSGRFISWVTHSPRENGKSLRHTALIDRMTGEEMITAELVSTGNEPSVWDIGQSRLNCEKSAAEPPPQRKF